MTGVLVVHKNRTNIITVNVGMDVSTEVLTSQIRTEPDQDAPLIVAWDVDFTTDGTDGELTLTLTNVQLADIELRKGYMDIKRANGSVTLPVFDRPLEVEFRGTVTT